MEKVKTTLSVLCVMLVIFSGYAQNSNIVLYLGDVTLSTQAEVDAFHYTDVTGTLTISGNDINNLDSLSELAYAGSVLITSNPNLTNVSGLSKLNLIGGSLSYLVISDNPSLTNIDGLSSLTYLSGHTASVIITNNTALENIDGLSSLSTLSYIGCTIYIANNPVLKNVDGFSALTQFHDLGGLIVITIQNNGELEDLDGLGNLRGPYGIDFSSSFITITNNPSLSQCGALYPLFVSIGWEVVTAQIADSSFQIKENGEGCTMEEILYGGTPVITALSVIDQQTGQEVYQAVGDTVTLDRANPDFSNWAVKAHTFPSPVGSVQFKLDNKFRKTDKAAPYLFASHQLYRPGTYTLAAVPNSSKNGKGTPGVKKTTTIIIINSEPAALIARAGHESDDIAVYPVPVENELFLKINDARGNDALLAIRNLRGELVYSGSYSGEESAVSGINTLNFQPGIYVLQIFGSDGLHKVVRFIKK